MMRFQSEQGDIARKFLQSHSLMSLSYVGPEQKPHSAVVEYVLTDDGEILFSTFKDKRKYEWLRQNSAVSIVVGWTFDENITIQYEGTAEELYGTDRLGYSDYYFHILPDAEKFADAFSHLGKLALFKVSPAWVRYSDFNQTPWEINEFE